MTPSAAPRRCPTPAPAKGDLSFAAFGKQDCQYYLVFHEPDRSCFPTDGSNMTNEVIARKVNEEIAARAGEPGGPAFSLFTGDASEGAGGASARQYPSQAPSETPLDRDLKHRNWVDIVADPLADTAGPVFGAIGGLDLGAVMPRFGTGLPTTQRTPPAPAPTPSGAKQWPTSPPGSKRRTASIRPSQAPPASPSSASRT